MAITTLTRPVPTTTEWRWTPAQGSSYDDLAVLATGIATLHELAITSASTPSYAEIKNQAARVADLVK